MKNNWGYITILLIGFLFGLEAACILIGVDVPVKVIAVVGLVAMGILETVVVGEVLRRDNCG